MVVMPYAPNKYGSNMDYFRLEITWPVRVNMKGNRNARVTGLIAKSQSIGKPRAKRRNKYQTE